MCTGFELAALGLTGAGAAYNAKLNNDYIDEVNRQNRIATDMAREAREEEVKRQLAMEGEQTERVDQGLQEIDPGKLRQKVADAADDPNNEFVTLADEYNASVLPGQTTSGSISETIGKMIGDSLTRTREILKAQSVLAGQGAALSGNQDELGRVGSDIQTTGSNRRRSAQVGMMETNIPPGQVTKSSSILGDMLMLGGSALGGGLFGAGGKAGVTGGAVRNISAFTPLAAPTAQTKWFQGIY